MQIFKQTDEWYYIGFFKNGSGTSKKYKCDQLEGLIKFLKDIKL